jgi:hypothetical protein
MVQTLIKPAVKPNEAPEFNSDLQSYLFGRLWSIVDREVRAYSMKFNPPCELQFREELFAGVTKLVQGDSTYRKITPALRKEFAKAEVGVHIAILTLIKVAQDEASNILQENFWDRTKEILNGLCPLFPICE